MKSISQIATICLLDWEIVYRAIQRLNITPVRTAGRRNYYDKHQQELIFDNLHHCGKLQYLTFESKLNDPNFDCPEVYSRENFIRAGHIIKK